MAIDIGHNAKPDTGASSKWGFEDNLTKEVGNELITLLNNAGYQIINVSPLNVNGVNDSLKQRIDKANKEEVDLFVSIHFNSSSNLLAEGTEIYYYKYNDELNKMSDSILNSFSKYGFKNRGFKEGNYFVLRNAEVPAILVECGFLSNGIDMAKYEAYKMAENIFNGIEKYFTNK